MCCCQAGEQPRALSSPNAAGVAIAGRSPADAALPPPTQPTHSYTHPTIPTCESNSFCRSPLSMKSSGRVGGFGGRDGGGNVWGVWGGRALLPVGPLVGQPPNRRPSPAASAASQPASQPVACARCHARCPSSGGRPLPHNKTHCCQRGRRRMPALGLCRWRGRSASATGAGRRVGERESSPCGRRRR